MIRVFVFMMAALVWAGSSGSALAFGSGYNSFGGFGGESSRPSGKSDGQFAQGEALRNGTFLEGEVVFARYVTLEGRYAETAGQVTGGALGALIGSKAGKGKGQYAGMIVGGLLGASVGGTAGRAVGEDRATEVFVKTLDGRRITVVQVMDREVRPGDKVFVTQSAGGNYRVVGMASMY